MVGIITKHKAEMENRLARRISIVNRKTSIENLLRIEVDSGENLIINGSPESQMCRQLFTTRLEQLYFDANISNRPVIVIAKDRCEDFMNNQEVLVYRNEQTESEGMVYLIDSQYQNYDPFLKMDIDVIDETLESMAPFYKVNLPEGAILLFRSVCNLLKTQGFEVSLYNLMKMYGLGTRETEDEVRLRMEKMLKEGGYEGAVQILKGKPVNFYEVQRLLSKIHTALKPLFNENGTGISMVEKIKQASQNRKPMPFFYFNISDGTEKAFFNYFQNELNEICKTWNPIVVLKDVKSSDADNLFFQELKRSSKIALNLIAQNCTTFFGDPEEDLRMLRERNDKFVMILLKTGLASEILTKDLGDFQHVGHVSHLGHNKGWMDIFPQGVATGMGEMKERLAVIRQEDISKLEENQCYVYRCDLNTAVQYKKITYN